MRLTPTEKKLISLATGYVPVEHRNLWHAGNLAAIPLSFALSAWLMKNTGVQSELVNVAAPAAIMLGQVFRTAMGMRANPRPIVVR